MNKLIGIVAMALITLATSTGCANAQDQKMDENNDLPKVYMIKDITSDNLVKSHCSRRYHGCRGRSASAGQGREAH